ncbi:MAG: HAD hydrolase family protein [Candidatus Omnitrophica bacterium]|nr:HAD hydrolase family protein [Candidatus Omnitrophota bacterium]
MIKLVLLDIDGVLTDGKVTVDSKGNEYKTICYKDIDAIFQMKRQNLLVGLVTGEATPITDFFKERFNPDFFYSGCKDKCVALKDILSKSGISVENVCYVGDSKHDLAIMKQVKCSACPSNAITEVKELAEIKLAARGGEGCVWELLEWIIKNQEKNGIE